MSIAFKVKPGLLILSHAENLLIVKNGFQPERQFVAAANNGFKLAVFYIKGAAIIGVNVPAVADELFKYFFAALIENKYFFRSCYAQFYFSVFYGGFFLFYCYFGLAVFGWLLHRGCFLPRIQSIHAPPLL